MTLKIPNALIVDDNPSDVLISEAVVQAEGYHTVIAKDGFGALDALHEKQFDLLIVDLNMPNMSGIELLKKIKSASLFEGPIIVMSARNQARDVEMALRFGAQDYIVKPVDIMVFQSKISKIKSSSDKEWYLYDLEKPEEVKIIIEASGALESISEVGFVAKMKTQLEVGDTLQFSLETLPQINVGKVFGRVTRVMKEGDSYRCHFSFVGLKLSESKNIRVFCTSLRSQKAKEVG